MDNFYAQVQDALAACAQYLLDMRCAIAASTGTLRKTLQAEAEDAEARIWRGSISMAVVFEQVECPVVALPDGWYLLRPNADRTVSIIRLDLEMVTQ